MERLYHCCAALDVHKASVVACRVRTLPDGQKEQEIRSFGTTPPSCCDCWTGCKSGA